MFVVRTYVQTAVTANQLPPKKDVVALRKMCMAEPRIDYKLFRIIKDQSPESVQAVLQPDVFLMVSQSLCGGGLLRPRLKRSADVNSFEQTRKGKLPRRSWLHIFATTFWCKRCVRCLQRICELAHRTLLVRGSLAATRCSRDLQHGN